MPDFNLTVVSAQLGGGLLMLAVGAECLVRGAARLARTLGVSAMVVGLTVVAFGTSAPELTVSLVAASKGASDIAVGNVVGSNIFNILAIVGLTALVCPIKAGAAFIRREIPIMIVAAIALVVVAWDGMITRPEAVTLAGAIIVYVLFAYWLARRESAAIKAEFAEAQPAPRGGKALDVILIIVGLAMLVGGSHLLVESAGAIARRAGMSEVVIGLTLVAAGTSLPELAASLAAALRRQPDIALGNVIGSCIFNVFCILGFAGCIRPMSVAPELMRLDIPIMVVSVVVFWPIVVTGRRVSRVEGLLLFAAYVGYTAYLVFHALGQV